MEADEVAEATRIAESHIRSHGRIVGMTYEDMVAEAVAVWWRAKQSFDGRGSWWGYCCRNAKWGLLTARKAFTRQYRELVFVDPTEGQLVELAGAVRERAQWETDEQLDAILKSILVGRSGGMLTYKAARASIIDGKDMVEISKELRTSYSTVAVTLHRAKLRLRCWAKTGHASPQRRHRELAALFNV